jgi:hypothetical protein
LRNFSVQKEIHRGDAEYAEKTTSIKKNFELCALGGHEKKFKNDENAKNQPQ